MNDVKKTVLFADLDGTIITTASGETFPTFIGDMKFVDGILDALKNFVKENETKYLFIVTNQAGIEKGYVKENSFKTKAYYVGLSIWEYLNDPTLILDITYCSSEDPSHERRKPNTGTLEYQIKEYTKPDEVGKNGMLMIGDASGLEGNFNNSDLKTAENFGIDYMDVGEFIEKYNKFNP